MAMGLVWTLMVTAALVCGAVQGMLPAVTAAAMKGASAAVELTLSMAGALCLWSGVMTVMERGGLTRGLARLFRPLLRRILPRASRDADTLNTASIQLLPTTVAAVRSAQGCAAPLDILPAVWLSSALSVTAGLLAARLLQRVWRA